MSRAILPRLTSDDEYALMKSLGKWAVAHELSTADLHYLCGCLLFYAGTACRGARARTQARTRVKGGKA